MLLAASRSAFVEVESLIFWFISALCFFIMTVMILLFILRTKLVRRLRNNYPRLYVDVGSPMCLSRSVGFLWCLDRYRAQLSTEDLKLLRLSLVLVYINMLTITLFMILVFVWFTDTSGTTR